MPASSDLSVRWLTNPSEVSPALRTDLNACWRDVVNGGGAVGFAEQVPVTADDVAPVVDEIAEALNPRLGRLLIATRDGTLAGWLLLTGSGSAGRSSVPGPVHCSSPGTAAATRS